MMRLLKRALLASAVGLVLSVWIIQNTPSVQERVSTTMIQAIEKAWNARISVASYKINFFTFSIYFTKGVVRPTDAKKYAWRFEQCKVHISPWQLLWNRCIALDLTFNHVRAQTRQVGNKIDLIEHVGDIFATRAGAGFSVSPQSITINNFHVDAISPGQIISVHLPCRFYIAKERTRSDLSPSWHGSLDLVNAVVKRNGEVTTDGMEGRTTFAKSPITGNWTGAAVTTLKSPWLTPQAIYTAELSWGPDGKTVTLLELAVPATKKPLVLSAMLTPAGIIGIKGTVPLGLLTTMALHKQLVQTDTQVKPSWSSLGGTCAVDVTLVPNPEDLCLDGSIVLDDVTVTGVSIPKIVCSLHPTTPGVTTSQIDFVKSTDTHITGTMSWNWKRGQGTIHLTNAMPITSWTLGSLPWEPLVLNPRDLSVSVTVDTNGSLWGTYHGLLTSQATEKRYRYTGALLLRDHKLGLQGSTTRGQYSVLVGMSPHPHLASWQYRVKNKMWVDLATTPAKPLLLQGTIHWSMIRSFLDQATKRLIFGNNSSLGVTLDQQTSDKLVGHLQLQEGRFYVPEYNNMVTDFQTDIELNLHDKKLMLDDIAIALSRGTVTCPRATIALTNNYKLGLVHMPFQLNNVFVNWKGDFYGFVYGNLLLNKRFDEPAKLSGTVVFKKSILKDGLLSGETGSFNAMAAPSSFPLGLDIHLCTERPMRAQTETINTLATVDLVIRRDPLKDFGAFPTMSGVINLGNGSLKFLNKKLHITYGRIQFVANQLNDPIVDLVAKNRVGKYQITLQATGSLQKPTILLESNPELSEEQIMGLLLAGSEHATLQADLPSMLLQNLDSLLVQHKKDRKAAFFDKITKTFKYVQITPNITDDLGYAGLKGSLSVDLSDQLHAQIQKNLDFDSSFSAQLEYMLSDDINLRVIRDQRGELGSEVEVRFKL